MTFTFGSAANDLRIGMELWAIGMACMVGLMLGWGLVELASAMLRNGRRRKQWRK